MPSQTLPVKTERQRATAFVLETLGRYPEEDVAPPELTRDTPEDVSVDAVRKAIWELISEHRVKLNPDYSMRLLNDIKTANGTREATLARGASGSKKARRK